MLQMAILFFVIAVISAVLAFGGYVIGALAKIIFFIFAVLFVISIFLHWRRSKSV